MKKLKTPTLCNRAMKAFVLALNDSVYAMSSSVVDYGYNMIYRRSKRFIEFGVVEFWISSFMPFFPVCTSKLMEIVLAAIVFACYFVILLFYY